MFKKLLTTTAVTSLLFAGTAMAADYKIDIEGQHAFINFKVNHLGMSWLHGGFNDFSGNFSYDAKNPEASKVDVLIKTNSVDTNHADRDKHIRSGDFLNVSKYPEARFVSTAVTVTGDDSMDITGDLTLNGVTKSIVINAEKVGEGQDPWGGYRAGFSGTSKIKMKDFGIKMDLGPASQDVIFELSVEGIRQ